MESDCEHITHRVAPCIPLCCLASAAASPAISNLATNIFVLAVLSSQRP